uniref:Endoplasmic reticulum transmembrane protein n=1 Tax=Eptatretus burgeri TaxID=7764 RepID=A0A8C4RAZ4_EPTBU
MGLQWTVVASFLYCEMLLILILYSSLISPSRWQKIFKSHLLNCTISYLNPCFLVFIIFIVILFADAIHEIRKYSDYDTHAIANMVSTTSDKMHMKLFRAQRNFYISGFSLLFWLIIRRLVMLISQQARLHLDSEVLEEQLQSADAAIKKCMKENKVQQEVVSQVDVAGLIPNKKELETDIAKVIKELEIVRKALDECLSEMQCVKDKAEGLSHEYRHLLTEHEQMQCSCFPPRVKREK